MGNFSALEFKLLSELDETELHVLIQELENSYDTPVGDKQTISEVFDYYNSKLAAWVVMVDSVPSGLFALSAYKTDTSFLQTTTLLVSRVRGAGVNYALKTTVAQTFLGLPLNLCSCVRAWNSRSLKAMGKAFPNVVPHWRPRADALPTDEWHFFFDLSQIEPAPTDVRTTAIEITINQWHASLVSAELLAA